MVNVSSRYDSGDRRRPGVSTVTTDDGDDSDWDDSGGTPASDVGYDNDDSGLDADTVQDAIDELAASILGGSLVPYYIPVDDTYTVPLYRQALFAEPIEVDGALVVNGILIGVD